MADRNLAMELGARWAQRLQPVQWSERVALLGDLYDFLRESVKDMDSMTTFFPEVVAEILHCLGEQSIASDQQAQVFATSSDPRHQELAQEWLRERTNDEPVCPTRA